MSSVMKPPATQLSIRRMTESDLDGVMAIERDSYAFPWSRGIFRDCLRAGYQGYVLWQDTTMIGYGLITVALDEAHLLNLCVHPDFRGQGHARALLHHVLDEARLAGARTFLLEVRVSNAAAIGLYHSLDFNEIATRPDYYPARDGREDALLMARGL